MRLRTFGAVYLERDHSPLGGAHSRRRRLALLAYLAAADGAAITRDKLIALLWPESDEASGRHSLSQLVYSLRHDVPAGAIDVDTETVRLNAAALPSDVHAFDEALRTGKLEDAVAEYRGPFLDGFHVGEAPELGRWIEEERGRCAGACGRALERLADAAEKAGDCHRALEWWRRRATMDPTDGRVTRRLMQSLAAIGDREGALRSARVYETLVREELESEPDVAVTQLAGQLRRVTQAPRVATVPDAAAVAPAAAAAVPVPAPVTADPASVVSRVPREVRRPAWHWTLAVLGVATGFAMLVSQLVGGRATGSAILGDARSATVVVGDLEGPDSVLSLAVREALRAELVNTNGVILTSDLGIRELKTLMRLPRDSPLRPPQLLALATRSGAHVAVTGSVVPVGSGAQIVLELLDPSSGRPIRTFAERPVNGAAILAAVERIGRSIGAAISQAPRDSSIRPLPAVTTASLPALKSYALARQIAASGERRDAVAPAERAVIHDSTFVLAHYFLGDLLWFVDEQSHSEAHLTKASQLIGTVPAREQLVIRARYEQLVRDHPDSALAYWDLLRDASPGDVLAYEGRAWALRALGRHEEAAASADTAMSLDPGAFFPNAYNAIYSWLAVGDTASALMMADRIAARYPDAPLEARYFAALFRGDLTSALALADSCRPRPNRRWRLHLVHLARGDIAASRATLDSIRADNAVQYSPNALLNQGWTELALGGDPAMPARYARDALDWLRLRDLSPPAVGRLSERIGDLAARAGDEKTVRATINLVRQHDAGRSQRSYVMTLRTLDAALAYVLGNFADAARRAELARHGVYFSRSLATIVQLEADARRAAGQIATADSLDRLVATHQIVDGHFETWAMLRAASAQRAIRRAKT
ncbi:MAG: BTAD domain-containing putative transcriptional regulator [Gemmatimonadaceae bacterium]